MHLLIAFDITCDKRRRKVVKLLEKHGQRMQMSIFEVQLSTGERNQLIKQIANTIEKSDRVHYLPLCPKDLGRRAADGTGTLCYFPNYFLLE